jgi:hypothetical protein
MNNLGSLPNKLHTSHVIPHARTSLGRLLSSPLGPLLQILGRLVSRPVRLDGLFAVGRELGLPVACSLLLLCEGVLLVLVKVCVCFGVELSAAHFLSGIGKRTRR